jgi:paraquat-inducible protein A
VGTPGIGSGAKTLMKTAKQIGAISCPTCHLLVEKGRYDPSYPMCPRCHAVISSRKKDSLRRTFALLIAAAIFYVPANFYPILTLISFGEEKSETILSGIFTLFSTGQWVVAVVVFVASVFVPIFKIIALFYLVVSVQMNVKWRAVERTKLYRFIETIGRWSMIDVFMISILAAIVKLKALATVEPEIGALAFAVVVILTMLAAMTFDPRLIWDRLDQKKNG